MKIAATHFIHKLYQIVDFIPLNFTPPSVFLSTYWYHKKSDIRTQKSSGDEVLNKHKICA